MPWPNRITGGRYTFEGTDRQLDITEPARTTAIHGLVRWDAWKVVTAVSDRVLLTHRLHPRPGYPFTLDLSVEYALSLEGLMVLARATNIGADACPFGVGFHPYLAPDGASIDGTVLALPAREPPDFLVPSPVGDAVLDTCFTDLQRDDAGIARVQFGETTLWVDRAFDYLMVFSADTLAPAERRRSLAVEPMTCAPDAFNSGAGLLVLTPGQTWTGAWGISP
jgi:aldose 1-epimerase